ncbi:hypothetical protein GWK47_046046 [Chionoecetes opilio]|uniref:Uncharacterized protein n=1 Tax=Chionoecetes opilio TaxID=41210 RepID=A0A8J4YDE3_CHIOP|nr:hypothetical protein GWK47_046046 [Chionoecetes opilio]
MDLAPEKTRGCSSSPRQLLLISPPYHLTGWRPGAPAESISILGVGREYVLTSPTTSEPFQGKPPGKNYCVPGFSHTFLIPKGSPPYISQIPSLMESPLSRGFLPPFVPSLFDKVQARAQRFKTSERVAGPAFPPSATLSQRRDVAGLARFQDTKAAVPPPGASDSPGQDHTAHPRTAATRDLKLIVLLPGRRPLCFLPSALQKNWNRWAQTHFTLPVTPARPQRCERFG